MSAVASCPAPARITLVPPSDDLSDCIADFLADGRVAGRAAWTLTKHRQELRRLASYLAERGLAWRQLAPLDLRAYIRWRDGRSFSARANLITTLRVFFRWSVETGLLVASPAAALRTPRRPHPQPRALTCAQVRRLLAHGARAVTCRDRRDAVLIATAIYTGLRAGELGALRWEAIDLDARIIDLEICKMGHGRSVALHPAAAGLLRAWAAEQPPAGRPYGFSLTGAALITNSVGKICRRASRASGVAFTAHILRHTFATWMLRRSHDLYSVSRSLGHKHIAQTEIYLSVDVEDIRPAIEALPGLGDW